MREEFAGAPQTGLHFVKNQQQAVAVADGPHLFEIAGSGDIYPPLPLDRFEHHRAGLRSDCGVNGCGIVERHMLEAVQQRVEDLRHPKFSAHNALHVLALSGRAENLD